MGSVDSAMGTSGFGDGVTDFLSEGADFSERISEMCGAIDGLNDGIPYVAHQGIRSNKRFRFRRWKPLNHMDCDCSCPSRQASAINGLRGLIFGFLFCSQVHLRGRSEPGAS